jgi:hypothetical protein
MSVNFGFIDNYARMHIAELLCEADHDRLADEATGGPRPVQAVVAHWLRAIADRLEGGPRRRTVTAVSWPTVCA